MKSNQVTLNRLFKSLIRLSGLLAGAGLLCGSLAAAPDKKGSALADEEALLVVVDDLQGRIDPEIERAREDLLRNAFYEAARRNKWLGEFDFKYNRAPSKEARGVLSFNVIDWEQTRSGFFECTLSARYTNPDGETLNLGAFHGMRSGISVTTRWDVGDLFSEVAQAAFEDAMKQLWEETMSDNKGDKKAKS